MTGVGKPDAHVVLRGLRLGEVRVFSCSPVNSPLLSKKGRLIGLSIRVLQRYQNTFELGCSLFRQRAVLVAHHDEFE